MVSTYPLNFLLAKDKGLDEEDNVDTCTKRGFVVNKKIRHSVYQVSDLFCSGTQD